MVSFNPQTISLNPERILLNPERISLNPQTVSFNKRSHSTNGLIQPPNDLIQPQTMCDYLRDAWVRFPCAPEALEVRSWFSQRLKRLKITTQPHFHSSRRPRQRGASNKTRDHSQYKARSHVSEDRDRMVGLGWHWRVPETHHMMPWSEGVTRRELPAGMFAAWYTIRLQYLRYEHSWS